MVMKHITIGETNIFDMKYIKLTARPNTWFKEGTEAYDYDCVAENKFRISEEVFNNDWKPWGYILCRGTRISQDSSELINCGEEYFDGESCSLEEFDVEVVDYRA